MRLIRLACPKGNDVALWQILSELRVLGNQPREQGAHRGFIVSVTGFLQLIHRRLETVPIDLPKARQQQLLVGRLGKRLAGVEEFFEELLARTQSCVGDFHIRARDLAG